MRIKVELHPDVVETLRHRCTKREIDEIYQGLEVLRTEPIRHSEMATNRRLSQYALRLFRFGVYVAVFEYDTAANRIRVLECRKVNPTKRSSVGDAG